MLTHHDRQTRKERLFRTRGKKKKMKKSSLKRKRDVRLVSLFAFGIDIKRMYNNIMYSRTGFGFWGYSPCFPATRGNLSHFFVLVKSFIFFLYFFFLRFQLLSSVTVFDLFFKFQRLFFVSHNYIPPGWYPPCQTMTRGPCFLARNDFGLLALIVATCNQIYCSRTPTDLYLYM